MRCGASYRAPGSQSAKKTGLRTQIERQVFVGTALAILGLGLYGVHATAQLAERVVWGFTGWVARSVAWSFKIHGGRNGSVQVMWNDFLTG